MKNDSLKIYSLSVCFVSLGIGAIVTAFLLFNVVKVLAPEATIHPNILSNYDINPNYPVSQPVPPFAGTPQALTNIPPQSTALRSGGLTVVEPPNDIDASAMRERARKTVIDGHRFNAIQSIIQQLIALLIAGLIFWFHWKLVKKQTAFKTAGLETK